MKVSLYSDALQALEGKKNMDSYEIQEEILRYLVSKYPGHGNPSAVDAKVKLLNLFYSTGIQATSVMTDHILKIRNIDARLKMGDHDLVKEIATVRFSNGERTNYSFATKYCALHQPDLFPIYDSIVAGVFCSLMKRGKLEGYVYTSHRSTVSGQYTQVEFAEKLRDYSFYVRVYKDFMQQYGLAGFSVRQIDWYLWSAYKQGGEKYEIEKLAPLSGNKYTEYKTR